ncbi:MAG TPA: peptide ABC transporter permease [Planctomycetes bacterium]|nr:peptide ABC transporter permease [Planctomycetota bacterium]
MALLTDACPSPPEGPPPAAPRRRGFRRYAARRALLMAPTFLGITLVTFVLCQCVPGGPVDRLRLQLAGGEDGGGRVELRITDKQFEALDAYYGFDKPILARYAEYLWNVVRLDLGDSFRYTMPVIDLIARRLPVSIFYGIVTVILAYGICIPLGILKAIRHRTLLDGATSALIFLGYAVPGFALGGVLLAVCAVEHDWLPIGGFASEGFAELSVSGKIADVARHAVLPVACYAVGLFAVMTMLVKNSLLEQMGADYVRTALAKGLTWRRAVFVHALRNALIPLATSAGSVLLIFLTGSMLIERVFNIPGIGLLSYEAVTQRDYPVVMGLVVISSALMLLGHLLSDLCVAAVDPRVRFE